MQMMPVGEKALAAATMHGDDVLLVHWELKGELLTPREVVDAAYLPPSRAADSDELLA